MMSKLFKPLLVIVVLGALVFAFYYLLMRPAGFTTEESVVEAFLADLDESNCEDYFIEETQDVCIQFVSLLEGEVVAITDVTNSGGTVTVDLTINDLEVTFVFEVVSVSPTGLKGILTKNYYYIDTVQ